jgi:hypothetical protein
MQKAVTTMVLVVSQMMKEVKHTKLAFRREDGLHEYTLKPYCGYNATICI